MQAEADSAASKAAFEGERARAGSLERTVRVLEAAAREGEARMAALVVEHAGTPEAEAEEGVPAGVERRDLALKQYFEREVMRALIPSDPAAKVLALAREVCGLKLVESQLLASLRAAHKRADAAHARVAALGDALEEAHAQLDAAQRAAAPEEGGSAAAAAAAAAQLSARSADVHRAKEEALVLGQRLAASEARCQELERERARLEALAVKASGDAQAAVNRVREEMLAAHEAHLSELEAEARAARASAADALRQARAHAARAAAEAAEERERAVEEALAGRADPGEVKAAEAAREEAEKRAEGAERKAAEAAEEAEAFLRDLKEAQRECMELREEREANGRAISQLEEALRAVERAGAEGAGAGARRGRAGGRGDRGSGAAAELSRQLVQVRMSEADAQRRLRVAARAELELREQLRRRDARIEELKGMAGQRRDDGAGRRAGAASAPGSPRGERGRMGAGSRGAISRGRDGGGAGGGVEVASLKSELARREAQIEHLEVSLARAIAAGRDRDADMAELRKREDMVEEAHDAAQVRAWGAVGGFRGVWEWYASL